MLKDFLRYYLGQNDQDAYMIENREKIEDLKEEIDQLQNEFAADEDLQELRKRVRDLEPITVNLTDREREVLQVFLEADAWLDTSDIAEALNTSRNNASSIMSNFKRNLEDEGVELESKQAQRNKMEYRLPQAAERKIFSQ